LDIGVLGYIGIVWPKEHFPEVWSVPPVTPCICKHQQLAYTGKQWKIMETFWQRAHMQAKALSVVLVKTPLCYLECSSWYLEYLMLTVKD